MDRDPAAPKLEQTEDDDGTHEGDDDEGFGVGFYGDSTGSRWPVGTNHPAPGSNAQSQPQAHAQPLSTLGQNDPHTQGSAASVTLIPDDPEQPLIECGRCVYSHHGGQGRVDIRAESAPGHGAPPGEPGWELVVGDADGDVCLSGVIERVERGVKIARYTVHITEPDSSSPFGQGSGP